MRQGSKVQQDMGTSALLAFVVEQCGAKTAFALTSAVGPRLWCDFFLSVFPRHMSLCQVVALLAGLH
jgi:hypothetical protein